MDDSAIRFFLASKTERGFVSYFERLLKPGAYAAVILKGGPGSGKSTLMKKIGRALMQQGHSMEFIPCASDPDSLDAIIDRTTRRAMLDGTAPHMLDPVYPGARDTLLNAGDAWDSTHLRAHTREIIRLSNEVNDCHAQASAFIAAAGALLGRCRGIAARYVDEAALRSSVAEFRLPQGEGGGGGSEYRLLSAVSVGRVEFLHGTLRTLCENVTAIPDEWGAASEQLLARVVTAAQDANQRTIRCPCSIFPQKTDHVLLPEIGVAFTCANRFHDAAAGAARRLEGLYKPIPARDADAMRALLFHAEELITCAHSQVALSKAIHDELERFYVEAMDFSKLDALFEQAMALMT
ncbi:MAG: hypothetical protein VB051_06155 [Candidatus Pelethousia sp.]|nr:hypothetical protein [Candidatus Pelethousia sp.]